ncbi:MAG: pantoate--beta-alanine ligase [Melioribacteraceae bacterium]|nr:pantoate--beta-alanine ligase [Melioribacteraceae bacterium]MCF8263636.1 pantoate--beta-alanine ligase [Melioribacteraceae bacterium]MCF8431890.1 pantoate--beta-alanine ligase [Melioribacteraceae bacterium]
MKVITAISEMTDYSNNQIISGKKIGLVPTMGFLHEGHFSLVRKCTALSDLTIVSIFLNPTQFAPSEDLTKYPRDFEKDYEQLSKLNVDVIFYPTADEIYPKDFSSKVEVKGITNILEGSSRPTHFEGVTTVVNILFNIVKPYIAVFGQKDAQQSVVIKKMVRDLKIDTKIIVEPIVREKDGLALSSRNIYLTENERRDALVLSKSLLLAQRMIKEGVTEFKFIREKMSLMFTEIESAKLDYIEVVSSSDFSIVENLTPGQEYFILVACKIGNTRLIDNILVEI